MRDIEAICSKYENELKELNHRTQIIEMPDTIYHYTTLSGFKGIFSSRLFWMTRAATSGPAFLNDPNEIKVGHSLLAAIFAERAKSIQNPLMSAYWDCFNSAFLNLHYKYDIYITSFCQNPDYLPAWEKYGDNGKGFAIGIKKEFFDRRNYKMPILICKVAYDQEQAEEMLQNYFAFTNNFILANAKAIHNTGSVSKALQAISLILYRFLLAEMCSIKSEDWRQELEYRLVATYPKNKSLPYKIHYKSDKKSTPYIHSPKFYRYEVNDIWIGPACKPEYKDGLPVFDLPKVLFGDHNIQINFSTHTIVG